MFLRLLSGLLLSLLVLPPALSQTPAPTPPPAPATRLETEYKLAVPAGQDSLLWRFLSTTYAARVKTMGPGWETALGEETFVDRYFDDGRQTLLRARAGLRHRRRFAQGQLKKQLVQLKITDDAAGMMREELKFKPVESADEDTPLAQLPRAADRPRLDSALRTLGVRLADLHPALTLGQRRRRLYLRLDGNDFATLTLDSSYHLGPQQAGFTEIEAELNEKRFTGASTEERARMQQTLANIKKDLLQSFPALTQDQRPKYNKLVALLPTPPAEVAPATPARSWRVPAWLLGGLLLLAGLGLWRRRAA